MLKTTLKMKNNEIDKLAGQFKVLDTSDFPDFYDYTKTLEKSLWVLWIAKERLSEKRLSAEQIALIIKDVKEISIDAKSITCSFNRAGDKIHTETINDVVYFEIMRPGKDLLISEIKVGSIELLYFEPEKRYTSKRMLSKNVLDELRDGLKIVDPYCSERTLDILRDAKDKNIKFLTRTDNLRSSQKSRFLRELKDFKSENPNVEFRNYSHSDIHDRYIISAETLVILGHSIKDLGAKESFAMLLSKDKNKNILEALTANFNRRWKASSEI